MRPWFEDWFLYLMIEVWAWLLVLVPTILVCWYQDIRDWWRARKRLRRALTELDL